MVHAELFEVARRAAALRHLAPEPLERLLATAQPHAFPEGEVLLAEGEPAEKLLLLLEGRVEVVGGSEDGGGYRIAVREAGDWLGEGALFPGDMRSATVRAQTAALVLEIDPKVLLDAVCGNVESVMDLLQTQNRRRIESDDQLIGALRQRVETLSSANTQLSRQNRRLQARLGARPRFEQFVGSSAAARKVRSAARQAAHSDLPILLLGDTGTGKEILARAIHEGSGRSRRRFVAVNCGLLTDSLLESELFGHAQGAFTGASRSKRGLVETAHGGTLLLDEVGDMSLSMQAGLLRFIELGEFRRVGETEMRRADVRVIAATHRSLEDSVAEGSFRRDLLYRLDVIRIPIPPMRERIEDLPLLVADLVERTAERLGVAALRFDPAAIDALAGYHFPGNVRELVNEIERLYAMLAPGSTITARELDPRFLGAGTSDLRYAESLRGFKAHLIGRALREAGGNRTRAAERLGLQRTSLVRMMRDLGLRYPP